MFCVFTSGAFRSRSSLQGLGLKALKAAVLSGEYEIGVGTRRVKAEVVWEALYDPRAEKMRDC